ncbi:hypothetical protein MBLNU457_7191t1 [Dothideomycetes sp. NU457]
MIQNATNFTTSAPELQFLHNWQPVLKNASAEISLLNPGGWRELYDMGVYYRQNYSNLLFARGYLGPDAETLGTVHVLNNSDPRSIANTLAASDLCPAYLDNSGGVYATNWSNVYTPPIVNRINSLVKGINFTASDVTTFPVLCGFETPITGRRSPWCEVLRQNEIEAFEYAQDIRYWYGSGKGAGPVDQKLMLPFLTAVVQRLVDGPNHTYHNGNSSYNSNPLIATFSNDGQINQLAAAIGVFDNQDSLPDTHIEQNRIFRSSYFVTMRGTITFERLVCGANKDKYMRIKLNDAVYPVPSCMSGPGKSCPLSQYQAYVANKTAAAGDFEVTCGIANTSVVPVGQDKTTFLWDLNLPFEYSVTP